MEVRIRRHTSSRAQVYKDVIDVYTKDALLCMYFEDGKTIKIPLLNIFDIQHDYKKAEETN